MTNHSCRVLFLMRSVRVQTESVTTRPTKQWMATLCEQFMLTFPLHSPYAHLTLTARRMLTLHSLYIHFTLKLNSHYADITLTVRSCYIHITLTLYSHSANIALTLRLHSSACIALTLCTHFAAPKFTLHIHYSDLTLTKSLFINRNYKMGHHGI